MIKNSNSDHNCKHTKKDKKLKNVSGQFIRTFTFGPEVKLEIVQPGGSFAFPLATIESKNVIFVDQDSVADNSLVGFILPRSRLSVLLEFNSSPGAQVSLLLNGKKLVATDKKTIYGTVKTVDFPVSLVYYIDATEKEFNFLSVENTGTSLLTLNDIPNTKVGNTSEISRITIQSV